MSTEVIEPEVLNRNTALVPRIDDALREFADPMAGVARATAIANALHHIIEAKGLSVTIQGGKHLKVEAWLTLGAICGVTASTAETRQDDNGYAARVEVIRLATGEVIGRAESRCDFTEKLTRRDGTKYERWSRDEPHACMSMAQTRATSKALAQVLRWIPVLAGYSGTPIEEMPAQEDTGRGGSKQLVATSTGKGDGIAPLRPVSARSAPEVKPAPATLDGSWLDEPVGFGKYRDQTWRHMSEGDFGGQRHGYCQWIVNTPSNYPDDAEKKRKAKEILASYAQTTVAVNAAADEAPRSDGWMEEQPPIPESPYDK